MKLIAEQVQELRKKIQELKLERKKYADYLNSREATSSSLTNFFQYGDAITEHQFSRKFTDLDKIHRILDEAEYVMDRDLSTIDIGTLFKIRFTGDDRDEELLLVEGIYQCDDRRMVALDSPLGSTIQGKKENDYFEYYVGEGGDRRKLSGVITEIVKDKNKYAGFIRERKRDDRMSRAIKKQRTANRSEGNYNGFESFDGRKILTISQVESLKREVNWLNKNGRDSVAKNRLSKLRNILSNCNIVIDIDSDKVEIGSEVVVYDDNSGLSKKYEIISEAFSQELQSEYIEAISPMGYSILGLSEGDKFSYRTGPQGSKIVNGIVLGINNFKKEKKVVYSKK